MPLRGQIAEIILNNIKTAIHLLSGRHGVRSEGSEMSVARRLSPDYSTVHYYFYALRMFVGIR